MRKTLISIACLSLSGITAAAADRTIPAFAPFSLDTHGGVLVNVRVNGAGPFTFILDTGASRTMIAEDLARELSAPVVARSEVVTIAGSAMQAVVRLASVSMPPAEVTGVLAPVMPAARLSSLGRGVRGLLGQDFLSAFNYTLDYRRGRLTWDEGVSCEARGAVRMAASGGRFVMQLEDEAGTPLRLVPDSGAELPVFFRAREPHTANANSALVSFIPGERAAQLTTVPRLRVGSVTLWDIAVMVIDRPEADADGLMPLHWFSSVSFAAAGACVVARR